MTAHTVESETSHCASQTRLAVMQWCMVSDRQQGCLAHPAPVAIISPQRPPLLPESDGSASAGEAEADHNKSVTVRLMQTDSYSLAGCAIRKG